MKQKVKKFIGGIPGVRGFLKKWRAVLKDVKNLKKRTDDLIKRSDRRNTDLNKKINRQDNALNEKIKILNDKIDILETGLASVSVKADIATLKNRFDEINMEKAILAMDREKAEKLPLKHLDKINYLESDKPFVSIIMLNRNGKENLKVLMNSLHEKNYYKNFEIICVDNASSDDSLKYLESWKEEFDITIIRNDVNMTFSAANNLGVKRARGDYLLFLNNDTEVTDGWLDELLFAMKKAENPGAIGAKLIYPEIPEGTKNSGKSFCVQHSGIAFRDATREKEYFIEPYNMGKGCFDFDASYELTERACVTAAVMIMTREAFDSVGGFDERYIYGYEDVDICLKLYKAGYKNYYCPRCLVYHYEFGTQSNDNEEDVKTRRLHNVDVFKGKWQKYLAEKLYNEKINGTKLFTEGTLTFAFVVTEAKDDTTAGDYFTAKEFATSIEKLGYKVKYLSRKGKNDWYNVGVEVDVLISLLDVYNVTEIYNCKNDIITIAWARNWFDRWCEREYFEQFDMVFASSKTGCEYVEHHSNKKAILFPIATNTDRFAGEVPVKLSEKDKECFTSDYAFTGSYWNVKREIMDYLEPSDIPYTCKIFGANWEQIDKFKDCAQGFVKYTDMPKVYENTKIVIDDANHVTKEYGAVNSRVFDALAAGTLVLTNGTIGAEETFNGMLPSFEGKEDFNEKLLYYLEHDEERNCLAEKLRTFVLKNHTYDVRAAELVEILKNKMKDEVNPKEIDICGAMFEEVKEYWGDYHFAVSMKKEFEKRGYKVNVLPRERWYDKSSAKYIIVLRGKRHYYQPVTDGRKYIMWNISHPENVNIEEYNTYDYVFFASQKMLETIGSQIDVPSGLLLQCTDDEVMVYEDGKDKEYELLFVGNSRGVYRLILKDLLPTEHHLSVYGRMWENYPVYDYVVENYLDSNKVGQAYHDAKILLNDHWDDMREYGIVSNRLFDALAARAFVISDYMPEIDTIFEGNIVTYNDKDDLKEKIDFYLEHDNEREEKAERGQKIVLNGHTFKDRVNDIINILDKL